MRKQTFVCLAALLVLSACAKHKEEPKAQPTPTEQPKEPDKPNHPPKDQPPVDDTRTPSDPPPPTTHYAPADGAIRLVGSGAKQVAILLKGIDAVRAMQLGLQTETPDQIKEIADFTAQLVGQAKSERERYDIIYKWIRENIKYDRGDNSAYATFRNRQAVCQGYSNLLKLMCYTQGIPCIVASGDLYMYGTRQFLGGHAWCYVYVGGAWYVADPTNGPQFTLDDLPKYAPYLAVQNLDLVIWEDEDFAYAYERENLTVTQVRRPTAEVRVTVPYSVGGFVITSFNPESIHPDVREVYLSAGISSLGPRDNMRLERVGKWLDAVYIAPENPALENYRGTVYTRTQDAMPLYIPRGLRRVELKGVHTLGKNALYGLSAVEELVVGEGTEVIEDYAVEQCPSLRRVYLPASVHTVGAHAFAECHPTLQIIRQ